MHTRHTHTSKTVNTVADDEVEKMRHAMAETASLLGSAAYQQSQADLQLYKERLTDHLADPSQPLNLETDTQSTTQQQGQQEGQQVGQQEGLDQQRGQLKTPPKTPGQDPGGRGARAKRAASSREVWRTPFACVCMVLLQRQFRV